MTDKLKWPRVSGGKCLEEWTVDTQAGEIPVRTYRVRTRDAYSSGTHWLAVFVIDGDFVQERSRTVDSGSETLDAFEERVRTLVRERAAIPWEPHLYIVVDTLPHDMTESAEEQLGDVHEPPGYRKGSLDLQLRIDVDRVDLATTPDGRKRQRTFRGSHHQIADGWPEVGAVMRHTTYQRSAATRSLIPDTPANRAALEQLRLGLLGLHAQLTRVLSPEHVERALAQAARLLPAPEESP